MILDIAYTNRDLYTSNQVRSRHTYLPSGLSATSLHIKSLYYLVNGLTDEGDIRTREKPLLHLARFLSLPLLRVLENSISYDLINRQSVRKLIT